MDLAESLYVGMTKWEEVIKFGETSRSYFRQKNILNFQKVPFSMCF